MDLEAPMATLPTPPGDLPPEEFFLGHLKLIEEIISQCCQRSRFSREEAEDFAGVVKCRLIENDYAVIREFKGRSSPKTYLTTVINNLLKDYRNHLWGKWRPSAEALRLGRVALRLEELVYKEGRSFDEACQILRFNDKVGLSRADLEALWAKLPYRTPRQVVEEEELKAKASRGPRPDERLAAHELERTRRRLYLALQQAFDTLSAEDRLLVKLRGEYSVADIARIQRVEQKPLYRRLEKIYKALRKELERHGVRRQDVDDVLGSLEPEDTDF